MKILKSSLLSLTALLPLPLAAQSPEPMTFLTYIPGDAWDHSKPADEQDLGSHFGFVAERMAANDLRAFGLQADAIRGYYLLPGSDAVAAFVALDPAANSKLLQFESTIGWHALIDVLPDVTEPMQVTILWYEPGEAWVDGKPLSEQDIAAHVAFIGEKTGQGMVLAGGPLDTGEGGLYILSTADEPTITSFLAEDPGVRGNIFAPHATLWNLMGARAAQ